ncbi:MAG: 16S rRNA (cytosine(1402)-N(4))-methyltransferase RsmH [Rhodospirillales bacterium]|jgi:16S rRNA (cytosine1402-N4)-methyltransferase|nr:16S rRNA (cytosine(1402)-N(4))-methyltransferase RsmH [Rhodospirillales bacterium]
MATEGTHIPVMLNEVLDALSPRDGGIYVDGTFGGGGYSRAVLDAADCKVWGIDRDPEAVARGAELSKQYPNRLNVIEGRFGDMDRLLSDAGVGAVDGVALDVGVSSMQIDDAARGFSFRDDGPLDMRMEKAGTSAADVVSETGEKELADIIYKYGEERASRRIARAIVAAREVAPISTTGQLASIIRRVLPRARDGIDPATRTFQALRIYVNEELAELDRGLAAAETLLKAGGRLAVVSFHSLEDRVVKLFMRQRSGADARGSRHLPDMDVSGPAPTFKLVSKRPLKPSDAECRSNPRARSARLRAAERTDAPAQVQRDGGAA